MKITVRQDKVVVDGYVNAVDRFSRPLFDGAIGSFIEKVLPNVFKRAIARAKNIDVYLNHDEDRKLASTTEGTAKVYEDNVGLRAIVEIKDPEVIEKARAGKLRGWSFGFNNAEDDRTVRSDGMVERVIKSLNLFEVSIIDDRALPCYIGTSIETRSMGDTDLEIRAGNDTEIEIEHADGGEDKPEKKNTTDTDSKSNGDPDPEEEAKKAQLEKERLARETVIRETSI